MGKVKLVLAASAFALAVGGIAGLGTHFAGTSTHHADAATMVEYGGHGIGNVTIVYP